MIHSEKKKYFNKISSAHLLIRPQKNVLFPKTWNFFHGSVGWICLFFFDQDQDQDSLLVNMLFFYS